MHTTATVSYSRIAAIGIASFLVLFLVVPVLGKRATQSGLGTLYVTPIATSRAPELTPQEEATVTTIVLSDALVSDIIDTQSYTTTAVVWHTPQQVKTGGAVIVELASEATVAADWPYVEYDDDGNPIYPNATEFYTATFSEFWAFADLSMSEVVQVLPEPEATVTRP